MENDSSQSLSLKILVEKGKNRVIFAESNKDFVEVILSFLTLPIGAVVKLTRDNSMEEGEIGCLNKLYESLENLEEDYLSSDHKSILLEPRSATEIYNARLKVNLTERADRTYYVCKSRHCDYVGYNGGVCCPCGEDLSLEVKLLDPVPLDGGVFFRQNARFMVTDNLYAFHLSTATGLSLLSNIYEVDETGTCELEERTLNIGKIEVLRLLKYSLTSRTPLSDTFLEPAISKSGVRNYVPQRPYQSQRVLEEAVEESSNIDLKLIVDKSNNRVLFAEAGEDFVDMLCSFLAVPFSCIFKEFPSLSFKGCMGNLYKCIKSMDSTNSFKSEEMKDILLSPRLPPGLAFGNKLFRLEEAVKPSIPMLKSLFKKRYCDTTTKSSHENHKIGGGFVKGPSMFMVTDDLSVIPLSPISGISLIRSLKVPFKDVEELEVSMGEKEALCLLAASLTSTSALTDVFMHKDHEEPTAQDLPIPR